MSDLERRLAFLGLSAGDLRTLAQLAPLLERNATTLVAAFYRHLLSFERTRQLLADPDVKERLMHKQREYLLSLADPRVDEAYVAERIRIGEVHERIGLEPRWYLGAYALYFSLLVPLIRDEFHHDLPTCERMVSSLVKRLMLDAQLAMEAYIECQQRQLANLNRELAASSRTLEQDFQAQTIKLRQTTERARAAEDLASMATLVAGLAHEIGTPMGVIQGHAEALEPVVRDERGAWRLKTIRDQIDRIANIIKTLLSMSRPRETVREPVRLEVVLENTLNFLREKLRRRRVDVKRSFEPTAAVVGDNEKLQQLFLNLFLNAADAMQEGGGELQVSLKNRGDSQVEVCVSDTGPGISAEKIERIFEPFYTTKAAGQGSGLGLAVAKGIVAEHGGEIDVESTPTRGTRFCIILPAADNESR